MRPIPARRRRGRRGRSGRRVGAPPMRTSASRPSTPRSTARPPGCSRRTWRPERRRPVPPAGEERRRGDPAGRAGRPARQRVRPARERRRAVGRGAPPRQLPRGVAERRAPIDYPYAFIAPSNTGVARARTSTTTASSSRRPARLRRRRVGFGAFPGQFGMVVFSKYPILYDDVRTFQLFRWKDMPGNLIPTPFYSPDEVEILRLSSKSHWDVRSRSAARSCTSSSRTRRRRCSTGRRIATVAGTTTRSASGPTTSRRASRLHLRRRGRRAA